MHWQTEAKLKAISDAFFNHPSPIERNNREQMFQAFMARLCLETKVDGWTNEGVVGGSVVPKR